MGIARPSFRGAILMQMHGLMLRRRMTSRRGGVVDRSRSVSRLTSASRLTKDCALCRGVHCEDGPLFAPVHLDENPDQTDQ